MRKFLLVGVLSAASMMAAPVLTVIPTLGPNLASSSFNGWTTNVINGLRGLQTPPVGVVLVEERQPSSAVLVEERRGLRGASRPG